MDSTVYCCNIKDIHDYSHKEIIPADLIFIHVDLIRLN